MNSSTTSDSRFLRRFLTRGIPYTRTAAVCKISQIKQTKMTYMSTKKRLYHFTVHYVKEFSIANIPPTYYVTVTVRFPTLGTGYMFSRACHRLHVFRAWHWLHVFPRLAPVTRFSALGTGYMFSRAWYWLLFSRAWHWLHVFPRLALVVCFPALGTGYMFSRAWHWLHVFPRLALVVCFPALGTGCMFSRTWHRLYVFPRL